MNALINVTNRLHGRYKFRMTSPRGVRETDWFDNLITNSGLDQIANGGGGTFGIAFLFTGCKVGTDNTPPAVTDTNLVAPIAYVTGNESSTESFVEGTPAYWKTVKVYRFNAGTATGNLSEVGVFDANGTAFSRALITDSGGTPITITVLADELLDVTYELRSYIDKTEYSGNVTISGNNYTMAWKPYSISAHPLICRALRGDGAGANNQLTAMESNVLGTVYEAIPGGGATPTVEGSLAAYAPGSYYADFTYLFNTATANFATGIGSLLMATRQSKFKMGFTPKIPKTNTNNFSVTFRISWARFTPP